jgi:hypothetical protein
MTDHHRQAAAFLAWHARRGGPWDEAFALWSRSKDLGPATHERVRWLVWAELLATGAVTAGEDAA